jgi:hypothetical protein
MSEQDQKQSELILCIPGPWESKEDLAERVRTREPAGTYFYGADLLWEPAKQDYCPLEFEGHDPDLAHAFRAASRERISFRALDALKWHRSVVYLRFPFHFLAQRRRILHFTSLLCQAGGHAVKLESSALSYDFDSWFRLLREEDFDNWHYLCTVLVKNDRDIYSVGMHHFSLPECCVSATADKAAEVVHEFNLQTFRDRIPRADGQVFSLRPRSQKFQMKLMPDHRYPRTDLFWNRSGIWHLQPI